MAIMMVVTHSFSLTPRRGVVQCRYQDCWVPKPLHVHIQKFMEPKAQRQMLDGEYTHRSAQLITVILSYFFSWFSSFAFFSCEEVPPQRERQVQQGV